MLQIVKSISGIQPCKMEELKLNMINNNNNNNNKSNNNNNNNNNSNINNNDNNNKKYFQRNINKSFTVNNLTFYCVKHNLIY